MSGTLAYCGAPPLPNGVQWNFDPILIAALIGGAAVYALGYAKAPKREKEHLFASAFAVGWLVLAVSFVSPLCNLSVALFSARIAQHMLLMIVAAPLIVVGGADLIIGRWLGLDALHRGKVESFVAPLLFALALWVWHMPAPYDATLGPHTIYWTMEISLLATSLLLWRCLLRDLARNPAPAIAASLFTGLQMTGLGAVLVFAPRALFSVHFMTTEAWGLSPMQDQQLGGLIMWLPFGLVLTAHLIACVATVFYRGQHQPIASAR